MTLYTNFVWALSGKPMSLLVDGGRVVARETTIDAPAAKLVDLDGRYVLPAFVDCHCHILPMGLDLQKLHLGDCSSQEEVLEAVRQRHADVPDGWLLAVHYDQTKYSEGHLHRDQLDRISSERPILLRHSSGHASVANSAALKTAGVDESTPDPSGGTYVRDGSGRLTGVLLEHAHELVSNTAPAPSFEEMVDAILRAGERMASWGLAAACDMMTGRFDLERELQAYEEAARRGCQIDTRLYVQWKPVFGPRGKGADWLRSQSQRVAGIKIFADGAIGSATAAIYGSYTGQPADGPRISRGGKPGDPQNGQEVSGSLIYTRDRLNQMVRTAHEAGFQVAAHSIGDHATDLVMDAYEATGEPSRHRIEHAMLLSDPQIARLAHLGSPVTFQPEFLTRFEHAYLRQLGPDRTAGIKRTRSVLDAGIQLGFSSDLPIVNGRPLDGICAASQRPPSFDPRENCTRHEAILLYTRGAAEIGGFDDLGTLTQGERAAFLVFTDDPVQDSDIKPNDFVKA